MVDIPTTIIKSVKTLVEKSGWEFSYQAVARDSDTQIDIHLRKENTDDD